MTSVWIACSLLGPPINPNATLCPLQYYEMSYGLNIEMHKQVGTILFLLFCDERQQGCFCFEIGECTHLKSCSEASDWAELGGTEHH